MTNQNIESVFQEKRQFSPSDEFRQQAYVQSMEEYQKLYELSVRDPESFWEKEAQDFFWFKKWDTVLEYDFDNKIEINWFKGAKTNITANCLDRHIEAGMGAKEAIIWEGNEPGEVRKITYQALAQEVCQAANVLKKLGVKKGDRVTIYMPMIPELAMAVLACARMGAVHSVVFGGFSAESLADRLLDANSDFVITADSCGRGSKTIPIKKIVDEAITLCEKKSHHIRHCLVVRRSGEDVFFKQGRDCWWHEEVPLAADAFAPEKMDAEDPLFILYTSGSTGKPKGVLHTTAGYMVYTATTFRYIFDYKPEDIYWCTADIGWITGHSYIAYGPLANAATMVMFEGVPNYPEPDRFWDICQRHNVTLFYTAPTALRALMREGESWVKKHDLSKLRLLGTVGEPINPEAWMWYYNHVGSEKCPIVDTWWQTETGGFLITPFPGAFDLIPGSAMKPFFGIEPKIVDADGNGVGPNEGGHLIIEKPWPGMMRTVYGHHERFKETYFSKFPGSYYTGDGAVCDEEGNYKIIGRLDDVLNVSGHRIGTAEVESSLVAHEAVAESAVVGIPHEVKGEAIYAFVTLKQGLAESEELKKSLVAHVRTQIGPIATPEKIQFATGLPKTRSGKIMRRILRKIAAGDVENLGDISTLADPAVVEELIGNKK